ncbi:response regulator transcription factor [Paenisporosarcina antarctica]|uniref:Response regulator transcription factor n=1 Tax=Paenisporosarcina antarctica TaxID=417367 RepID=A0A4P7A1C7_9BACL|nr:response regulator transcription factor [Paenisporosarcina antarctica]QBP42642.1 response regulator transcription factor [Paenisporosarcina antarctica]
MSKSTILIADDQPLIRDGLAAILSMEKEYIIVAKTGDGLETIKQVQVHRPQLVLMDIQMPNLNGLKATKIIKTKFPDTKVLILTTFEDEDYIWEAISHGASGFLVKGDDTEKILSTVKECLDGRINYPSSIQLRLAQALLTTELNEKQSSKDMITNHFDDEKLNSLSIQERDIVRKLKQGKSNQTIASELYLSTGTIKNYLSIIYKKLQVSSRSKVVAYLYENDL